MRYIIANNWSHFIEEDGKMPERDIRWVFDTEENEISHLEIYRERAWEAASKGDFANVEDHIKNANPDAIDSPEDWGLDASDELPGWAGGPVAQPAMR